MQSSPKRRTPASGNELGAAWNDARWGWKRAVRRDKRLTAAAKSIAVTLVDDYANHENGRCHPFITTLCEATAYAERTVQKALADLEACGWIIRSKGLGRGRASGITFTADACAGAIIPKNVTEIAPYRERKATKRQPETAVKAVSQKAKTDAERVQSDAPKPNKPESERVQSHAQKGAATCGSLIEPPVNQRGGPQKPPLNLRKVALAGSRREAQWNAWLAERGEPTLAELAVRHSTPDGEGWEVPFGEPPTNEHQGRITVKWLDWALYHMPEVRHAATG